MKHRNALGSSIPAPISAPRRCAKTSRQLDAVVFTHSHTDHIMGFDDLRRFGARVAVSCRSTPRPKRWRIWSAFSSLPSRRLNPFPGYLKPEPHIIDRVRFSSAKRLLLHCRCRTATRSEWLFLFPRRGEAVAYLSDCSGVPDEIARKIEGVKVLIIDALRHKPHPTHLSVDRLWKWRRRCSRRETYFTHIAHELPQAAEAELPPHAHIAYDGLKLEL